MRTHPAPIVVLLLANVCSAQWTQEESGTKGRLRGLSVVSRDLVWTTGSEGTCLRSSNGGKTWEARTVPGASGLDFRDVHAVDACTAYLLAIGAGEKSRIYKTNDGGATWTLQFAPNDPRGFLDAIAFWNAEHGLALGDPVDGRFSVLTTDDGGRHWNTITPEGMPPALAGEGAFAASGTCLVARGDGHAWFGTGGGRVSRVFRSTDRGRTWTVQETPVRAGSASAGIFSLAFWDADRGVAVGGDYKKPEEAGGSVAWSRDGGRTWSLSTGTAPGGYRSGAAVLPGMPGLAVVAVGPTGTDLSRDGGASWRRLGAAGFDAVGFAGPDLGWGVGENGRIARFTGALPQPP